MKERLRKYLHTIFTLDLRALALFRIFLAVVLIGDISVRFSDLQAFYSNQGVLPLDVMHEGNYFSPFSISVHMMNGALWFQTILVALAYVFAICMLVGYRTRLFTFLSFFMLFSIQTRNPLVLQGGDDFLRLLLFWAIFLPSNRVWAVDAIGRGRPGSYKQFDIANIGYVLLLFSVYFFTSLMKHSPEWYRDGTALYYAFSIDQMVYPASKLLYPYPNLLKALTFGTIGLELIAPLLLLIPYKPQVFKTIFVVGLTMLHVGIGLTMQVGYFFIISIVGMIGLWPEVFFRPLERLFDRLSRNSLIKWFLHVFQPRYVTKPRLKRLTNTVMVSAIGLSLVWNIGNVAKIPQGMRSVVLPVGKLTGLSQNWGMFAPTVFKGDGWYVYEAITESGDTIDILKPETSIDYSKPEWVVYQYKNAKWRKLGENLMRSKNKSIRTPFCRYQLTNHNRNHPDQKIWKLNVLYFREKSLPNYEVEDIEKGKICSCFLKNKGKETASIE
ncbi:MAG: HTTM domain-containing protein [Bacteroidia bacterium]|nr:HTTM domain-containing protein [Bacteroidia bacterium]